MAVARVTSGPTPLPLLPVAMFRPGGFAELVVTVTGDLISRDLHCIPHAPGPWWLGVDKLCDPSAGTGRSLLPPHRCGPVSPSVSCPAAIWSSCCWSAGAHHFWQSENWPIDHARARTLCLFGNRLLVIISRPKFVVCRSIPKLCRLHKVYVGCSTTRSSLQGWKTVRQGLAERLGFCHLHNDTNRSIDELFGN